MHLANNNFPLVAIFCVTTLVGFSGCQEGDVVIPAPEAFEATYIESGDDNGFTAAFSSGHQIADRDGVLRNAYRLEIIPDGGAARVYWYDAHFRWVRFDLPCAGTDCERSYIDWQVQGLLPKYGFALNAMAPEDLVVRWNDATNFSSPVRKKSSASFLVDSWGLPDAQSILDAGEYSYDNFLAPTKMKLKGAGSVTAYSRTGYTSHGPLGAADVFPMTMRAIVPPGNPEESLNGLDEPFFGNVSLAQAFEGAQRDSAPFRSAVENGCLAGFGQFAVDVPDMGLLTEEIGRFHFDVTSTSSHTRWDVRAMKDILDNISYTVSAGATKTGASCADIEASGSTRLPLVTFVDRLERELGASPPKAGIRVVHRDPSAAVEVARGLVLYRYEWAPPGTTPGTPYVQFYVDVDPAANWAIRMTVPPTMKQFSPVEP